MQQFSAIFAQPPTTPLILVLSSSYERACVLFRWWNVDIWTPFFTEFLNIPGADELPNLDEWIPRFQDFFIASKAAQWGEVHAIIKSAPRR